MVETRSQGTPPRTTRSGRVMTKPTAFGSARTVATKLPAKRPAPRAPAKPKALTATNATAKVPAKQAPATGAGAKVPTTTAKAVGATDSKAVSKRGGSSKTSVQRLHEDLALEDQSPGHKTRTEKTLESSGTTVAPPPRSRSTAVSLPPMHNRPPSTRVRGGDRNNSVGISSNNPRGGGNGTGGTRDGAGRIDGKGGCGDDGKDYGDGRAGENRTKGAQGVSDGHYGAGGVSNSHYGAEGDRDGHYGKDNNGGVGGGGDNGYSSGEESWCGLGGNEDGDAEDIKVFTDGEDGGDHSDHEEIKVFTDGEDDGGEFYLEEIKPYTDGENGEDDGAADLYQEDINLYTDSEDNGAHGDQEDPRATKMEVDDENQLYGASRMTGGKLRGRACGNGYNIGDLQHEDLYMTPQPLEPTCVYLRTNADSLSDPMFIKCHSEDGLPDVLRKLAMVYSPIKKSNSRISVRDRGAWSLKGRFNNAMRVDGPLPWVYDEHEELPYLEILAEQDMTLAPAFNPNPSTVNPVSTPPNSINTVSICKSDPTLTPFQSQLVMLLNIPSTLTTRPKTVDVRLAYMKYQEFYRAHAEILRMVGNGTWTGKVPNTDELVEVFVSKSVWFQNYTKVFPLAQSFSLVRAWLERPYSSDSGDDSDASKLNVKIFGVNKPLYKFSDLKAVLKDLQKLKDKKGKRKAEDSLEGKSHKKSQKEATSSYAILFAMLGYMLFFAKLLLQRKHDAFSTIFLMVIILGSAPVAAANPDCNPFPDVKFQVFNNFIMDHFHSQISLATVLTMLFTLTNNPDLLNLHFRQQNPKCEGELPQKNSAWMKALARALENKLDDVANSLFRPEENKSHLSGDQVTSFVSTKLDGLAKILKLNPYNKKGEFLGKLKPVSDDEIQPILIICPISMECMTETCEPHAILKKTRDRDTAEVMLIKGSKIYDAVPVLAGHCSTCKTSYHADHERSHNADEETWMRLYLNKASYMKVGQSIWVDRVFSNAVLNATYHFHASISAFAEFWNASFWSTQRTKSQKVSRRQLWQAFVQESLRKVALASNFDLELPDNLSINQVTKQAFEILGENGVIRCAEGHACSECTHKHKSQADVLPQEVDPAGVVGVDEGHQVPTYVSGNNASVRQESTDNDAMDVDDEPSGSVSPSEHITEDEQEHSPVHMIVLDGIVMGPKHCSFEDCAADLANYKTGVFCQQHEEIRGHLCRIQNCQNPKANGIHTCQQHRERWRSHVIRFGRSTLLGVRRILRRSEEERLPWLPASLQNVQPHDAPAPEPVIDQQQKTYFVAPRFYCVETICAPCGVVIAWAKFKKSESPTHILDFLDRVYPDANSRPDYICIDKACAVLRHAVASGRWNAWKNTSCFIVDSYHYINHRTTDSVCQKWCNPAPLNGSAPNLVVVEHDKFGEPHLKRAFNTQACEQLNAWLGGFESILSKMTGANFDWFLHSMLFMHTLTVIEKQDAKTRINSNILEEEVDSDLD